MELCKKCKSDDAGFDDVSGEMLCRRCRKQFMRAFETFLKDYFRDKQAEALKECEESGHMWTWWPHDESVCMRCHAFMKKVKF